MATGITNLTGGGVLNIAGTVNNGGTVTIATGTFNVTGASSSYNNSSAVVAATTTITTGSLNLTGNTPTLNNVAGDTMSISTTGSITVGNLATKTGILTNAGTLTLTNGGTVNANGNFTNSGTFSVTGVTTGQLNLRGATSTIDGAFDRGGGTVTMNGSAPLAVTQTLSGIALTAAPAANGFNNLVVNNTTAFGVTLGSTMAVKGTLTLTSGNVTTGAFSLATVPSCATPSVVRTSGHVIGNLQKAIPAGASSCTFEVGTAAGYIPVGTTFVAGTGAGNVTASAAGVEHPSVGSSSINSTRSVNRYWTLTNGAAPLIALPAAGFTAVFNFITPGDYDGGATDPAKFTVQRFSGGWSSPAVNATCAPIAGPYLCNRVNGLTVAAGFGDFAIGEANYTAGNAGWFNVFETSTGAGATVGSIYTKLVGTGFSLDVVAINALRGGVKPNYSTNPITVELLNASDNTGALSAETDCRASWSLIPGQSYSLSPAWSSSRATIAIPAQASAAREVRFRVTQGSLVGCSTDNHSIRPTAFTVSSSNATNTGTSGAPTFKAGSANFNLTASSVAGYNGTPSVNNTAGMVVGTPIQGAIGGTFTAAPIGTGTATGSTFTYSEVGNFGLAANAVFDASFTGVDAPGTDCNVGFSNVLFGGRYGCSIGSTAVAQTTGSSGFGRFIPDHFALTLGSVATRADISPACAPVSSFTYLDERKDLGFTLTARNSANATTLNYAGAYAKLVVSTFANLNLGARSGTTNLSSRIDPGSTSAGSWTSGVANVTVISAITRAAGPDGPYSAIAFGIVPTDSDSVTMNTLDLDVNNDTVNDRKNLGVSTEVRFGRLRMLNASGSEKLDLPIPTQVQYWNGTLFTTNTADSCTTLAVANMAFSARTGGITASNMNATNISPPTTVPFTSGVANLKLIKPTTPVPTTSGSATLTVNLTAETKAYLKGNWGVSTFTADPSSRASFGTFSSQPSNFIFFRENY